MASHAHSTRTPLLSLAGAMPPLLSRGADRQSGPVTIAIGNMRPNEASSWELRQAQIAAEEKAALRALRRRVAQAVSDGIAFLDETGGDPDLEDGADGEPSLCGLSVSHPSYGGDDWEAGDDNGIGDADGLTEQWAGTHSCFHGAA